MLSEWAKDHFKIKLDPSVIFCSQQFSKLSAIKQAITAFSPLLSQRQRDNNRNPALANYSCQPSDSSTNPSRKAHSIAESSTTCKLCQRTKPLPHRVPWLAVHSTQSKAAPPLHPELQVFAQHLGFPGLLESRKAWGPFVCRSPEL